MRTREDLLDRLARSDRSEASLMVIGIALLDIRDLLEKIEKVSPHDKIEQQRETSEPRYKCEHVKAGFLAVARIDMDKWTIDVCQRCFDWKAFMDFVGNEPVADSKNDVL